MIEPIKILLSANPDELGHLTRAIGRAIPQKCGTAFPLQVIVEAGANPSVDVEDCDLVVGLLGRHYGAIATGRERSVVHVELERAISSGQPDLLVFADHNIPADPGVGRILDLTSHHCRAQPIWLDRPLKSTLQVTASISLWLEGSDPEPAYSTESGQDGLGRPLPWTRGDRWKNDRLGWLDARVLGHPGPLPENVSGPPRSRIDTEWNDACEAYRIGSLDLTVHHLKKVVEIRPLHGEAQLWLARLLLCSAVTPTDYSEVISHAGAAATTYRQTAEEAGRVSTAEGRTNARRAQQYEGYAHLIRAKALGAILARPRDLNVLGHLSGEDLRRQQVSAAADSRILDWHCEPCIEHAVASASVNDSETAVASAQKAFHKYPGSLHMLSNRALPDDVLTHVVDSVSVTMEQVADRTVSDLLDFRARGAETVNNLWHRSVCNLMEPLLQRSRNASVVDPTLVPIVDRSELDQFIRSDVASESLASLKHNPVQMTEAAQTVVDDNLRLLRTNELLLRCLAHAHAAAAEKLFMVVNTRTDLGKKLWRELAITTLIALMVGIVAATWSTFFLSILLAFCVVGYRVSKTRQEDQRRFDETDAVRIKRWRALADARTEFSDLVVEFESRQLDWHYLQPRSSDAKVVLRVLNAGRDASLIDSNAILSRSELPNSGNPFEGDEIPELAPRTPSGDGLYGHPVGSGAGGDQRWLAYRFPVDDEVVPALVQHYLALPGSEPPLQPDQDDATAAPSESTSGDGDGDDDSGGDDNRLPILSRARRRVKLRP